MSKVLLINPIIREFAEPNNEPLGLLYIASLLESHGHEVDICDMNALRVLNPNREFWLRSYMKPYDYVGISGLIVTYNEQRQYMEFIAEHFEAFGEPILILGGGLASSAPEFALRNMPALDFVVIGEGELTLLDYVEDPRSLMWVSGIAYLDHADKFIKTEPTELIDDLNVLPFPAWEKVPTENVYLGNPIWGGHAGNSSKINYVAKRSMNMIVSRGCPMSCNFCYHYVFGKKYRIRSVANVICEIVELKQRYNIDFIGFVDDNTTANRKWIIHFCEELIKLDINIKWGGSARVDAVDPEMLAIMKQAGCEWLGFGVESASSEILQSMNKKANAEQASKAIKMVRDAGIWANATFIAGYPGETKETFRATAKFMKDNDCLNSMFFAQPYPGTVLYEQMKDRIINKYGSEDDYIKSLADGTELKVNLTDMTDDELKLYRQKAMVGEDF